MMRNVHLSFCICVSVFAVCVVSVRVHRREIVVEELCHQDTLDTIVDRITCLGQRFDQRLIELEQRVDTFLSHCPSTTDTKSGAFFRITNVKKRETADFFRIIITYEAVTKPFITLKTEYKFPNVPVANSATLGTVQVDIPKDPYPGYPELRFQFPDRFFKIKLSLDLTPHSMDLPDIQFEVWQGKDVKFPPGQQVRFDFNLDVEGDVNDFEKEYVHTQILMQSDTDNNVINRYYSARSQDVNPAPVKIDIEKKYGESLDGSKGHRFGKAVLHSTREDAEGIVDWLYGIDFNCSRNCLVISLVGTFRVEFYRQDHKGPFPEGFLGFIHNHDLPSAEPPFFCDTDSGKCLIYCEAFGDGLIDVAITRDSLSPGEDMPDNDLSFTSGNWGISQMFLQNVSFNDTGEFYCTARSQSKEISDQVTLTVIQRPNVITQLSNITAFQNGSTAITCVAEGIPAPRLTLIRSNGNVIEFNPAEDDIDVHVTHPSQSRTRLTVIGSRFERFLQFYVEVLCRASNVADKRAPLHEFDDVEYLMIMADGY